MKVGNTINKLTVNFILKCSLLTCLPLLIPFPGSIAISAFLQSYLFCASFVSSWCSFISLRTLSIHLSLGLPQGLFPA